MQGHTNVKLEERYFATQQSATARNFVQNKKKCT
jgi:hypothetical protein